MLGFVLKDLHIRREGNGSTLLFLVGVGGRTDFWEPQIERLGDSFDCITFDHRKTGDPLPKHPKDAAEYLARYVLDVMDALHIEKVNIVGHSFGAAIAQYLAVYHSDRLDRLILSSAWAGPNTSFLELFRLRKSILRNSGVRDYLMQAAYISNPAWWVQKNIDAIIDGVGTREVSFHDVEVECHRMDAVTGHDLRAAASKIATNTLILAAKDDLLTPPEMSLELATLIPAAQFEMLETGGHLAPLTVPDAYAQRIRSFVA